MSQDSLTTNLENREFLMRYLREELVGPSPAGPEVDPATELVFSDRKLVFGPWRQKDSGEEILFNDAPNKRYGVGVLYPMRSPMDEDQNLPEDVPQDEQTEVINHNSLSPLSDKEEKKLEKNIKEIESRHTPDADTSDELDLSTANAYRQSSMGLSFLAEFPAGSFLKVEVTGGRYIEKETVARYNPDNADNAEEQKPLERKRKVWLRIPVSLETTVSSETVLATRGIIPAFKTEESELGGLKISIEVFSRPKDDGTSLLTVCVVNRTETFRKNENQHSLFQTEFTVSVCSEEGAELPVIRPYPERRTTLDAEEHSLALLYHRMHTFAVGHGCAADWAEPFEQRTTRIKADCLPHYHAPSITSDIRKSDKELLEVRMDKLAGLVEGDDGFRELEDVIRLYDQWILDRENEAEGLDEEYQEAAKRHMNDCRVAAARMKKGFAYLKENALARKAFQLANQAILLQQIQGIKERRKVSLNSSNLRQFSRPYEEPDPLKPPRGRGNWRAFQIAFLLMSLESAAEEFSEERETVELIWFPTGGGKTEAYLGLAAFDMFLRRLKDPDDSGTHVLMRYTLRLLTTQQFQRAASLICAMEKIRRDRPSELGRHEFSIGIWVGSANTPNSRKDAKDALNELKNSGRNRFVLGECPWCKARIGPSSSDEAAAGREYARRQQRQNVFGLELVGARVYFKCPDNQCLFSTGTGLPVYVVDEDIYEERPSLIIGTVDKFASLAWIDKARKLFGLDETGDRFCSPPGLIIQDELHLISGPLGSMVGLYEAVIEDLCTDHRKDKPVKPKIICSTATIRRFKDQIRALYGREDARLFPSPGLDAGDSFFACYDKDANGRQKPGRMYVGIHAPGLGSLQTAQVNTFTALMQGTMALPPDQRDPWWTLLLFYNSIRELGGALTLFQTDIPDHLGVLSNREGLSKEQLRPIGKGQIKELTSRLSDSEVPEAINALNTRYEPDKTDDCVDVCLASNIIEVGVDIDRLSLMAVIGQPKSTSQYIQVTGRVGRKYYERPGLIVTLYSASKPRDRSHFERFRSYHEKLYAQVEPTSVTPFSLAALERALHAVVIAYVRQNGTTEEVRTPYPYPEHLVNQAFSLLNSRMELVDKREKDNFLRVFRKKKDEWHQNQPGIWEMNGDDGEPPLMIRAGSYAGRWKDYAWSTPNSLRNVDSECRGTLSTLYLAESGVPNE